MEVSQQQTCEPKKLKWHFAELLTPNIVEAMKTDRFYESTNQLKPFGIYSAPNEFKDITQEDLSKIMALPIDRFPDCELIYFTDLKGGVYERAGVPATYKKKLKRKFSDQALKTVIESYDEQFKNFVECSSSSSAEQPADNQWSSELKVLSDYAIQAEALYCFDLPWETVRPCYSNWPSAECLLNLFNLRNPLNAKTFELNGTDCSNLDDPRNGKKGGINWPMIFCSSAGSCSCWHQEQLGVDAILYLYSGSPKIWLIVEDAYTPAFLDFVKAQFDRGNICDNVCANKSYMFNYNNVLNAGIQLHALYQEAGTYVILNGNQFHCVFNCGSNIGFAMNFVGQNFFKQGFPGGSVPVPTCSCRHHNDIPPLNRIELIEMFYKKYYIPLVNQNIIVEIITDNHHRSSTIDHADNSAVSRSDEQGMPGIAGANSSKLNAGFVSGKCDQCGKFYKHLKKHTQKYHVQPWLKCTVCEKVCRDKAALASHIQAQHEGGMPKKFECEVCKKLFSRKSNLRVHARVHESKEMESTDAC